MITQGPISPTPPEQPPIQPASRPERPSPVLRRRLDAIRSFFSTVLIVILAVGFAIFLTTYVFQSYQVEGPSMQPTLQDQDRLIVWKIPRTVARISGNSYIPKRGDIIVFTEPGMFNSDGSTKQLIKRVIALPGERVVVANGEVRVYNQQNQDGFNPDITLNYNNGDTFPIDLDEEIDEVVTEDHVFVMGDNRSNSLDSRVFGPIDVREIVGKLSMRILPIENARRF